MNSRREVGRAIKATNETGNISGEDVPAKLEPRYYMQRYAQRYASWAVIARVWPWPNRLEFHNNAAAAPLWYFISSKNTIFLFYNFILYLRGLLFVSIYLHGKMNIHIIEDDIDERWKIKYDYFTGIIVDFAKRGMDANVSLNEHHIRESHQSFIHRVKNKSVWIIVRIRCNYIFKIDCITKWFFSP